MQTAQKKTKFSFGASRIALCLLLHPANANRKFSVRQMQSQKKEEPEIFISASRVVRLLSAKCETKQSSAKGKLENKKSSENI
jgi:hypothetical protein